MLESLYVKNLALIDKTEVCFTPGLNILSGETGAGKSIIIGSVLMALGAKVPKDIIRSNQKEAYIELVFSINKDSVKKRLAEQEIETEDDQLIISRKITGTKSFCKINGESVTAAKVKDIASLLIDIHGQHEHQSLLYGARQMEIVDRSDRTKIYPTRQETARLYKEYQSCKEELERSSMDESMRIRAMDILNFEIGEIEDANIRQGEEKELEQEWKRLRNQEQIQKNLMEMQAYLSYDDSGAGDLLGRAQICAKEMMEFDSEYEQIYSQLMDAESIISDCYHTISHSLSEDENQEERFAEVDSRLDEIRHLMQKYGCDEEGLLKLLAEKQQELDDYKHLEERKARLEKKLDKVYTELSQAAKELTALRKKSAKVLEKKLTEAMIDLNFLDVRFEIRMTELEQIGHNGKDEAVFYIATNPGEPLKPLAKVASGGELSRIMLAIKSVLAENEETETLIFDEIDAGISGRTAQKVAKRLNVTARSCQVICISHLPQIVSMADTHFLIQKDAKDQVTTTHISELSEEDSVTELARLLGGTKITERVLENAREMKAMAAKEK